MSVKTGQAHRGKMRDQTLRAIISWGRYAEAFAYDDESAVFSLENPT